MRPVLALGIIIAGLAGGAFLYIWSSGNASAVKMSLTGTEPYREIVNPSGFVNSDPFTLQSLIGKKVILLDFLTYSCINCQRTFPALNAWYSAYEKDGLEIIGIHTPEFSFEKNLDNVRAAAAQFGIKFPLVLDNDYSTWNSYGNQYWPHKYLIDIHGNIIYDHIGEGGDRETEAEIRKALDERASVLGQNVTLPQPVSAGDGLDVTALSRSQEIYFGAERNSFLANDPGMLGESDFMLPDSFKLNSLYLGGKWNITPEYAEAKAGDMIAVRYRAKEVYFVANAPLGVVIHVFQDGKLLDTPAKDVVKGAATIKEDRLYTIIQNSNIEEHVLEIRIEGDGLKAYTLTFG